MSSGLKNLSGNFKVYIKATIVYTLSIALLYLLVIGIQSCKRHNAQSYAIKQVNIKIVPRLQRVVRLVKNHIDYEPTIQPWRIPIYTKLLSPINWLIYEKNCFLACRMNAMKGVGILPKNMTMEEFLKRVKKKSLLLKWKLYTNLPMTDRTLNEINRFFNKGSKKVYKWYALKSMNEIVYAASKGQHVMIYNQVWIKPTKGYPKMRLYIGNFAHVSTITGLKSYDAKTGIYAFTVYDPIPFTLARYPVYTKLTKNGWNTFGRQSFPFVVKHGNSCRSGYIIRIK